jgi:hypothetical protein
MLLHLSCGRSVPAIAAEAFPRRSTPMVARVIVWMFFVLLGVSILIEQPLPLAIAP